MGGKSGKKRGLRAMLSRLLKGGARAGARAEAPAEAEQSAEAQDGLRAREKAEEAEQRLLKECQVPVRGNCMYKLFCDTVGRKAEEDPEAVFSLSVFMRGGALPDKEQRGWIAQAERQLRCAAQGADGFAEPMVFVSADGLGAWVLVPPPAGGGRVPDSTALENALQKAGVTFGVRHDELQALCDECGWLRLWRVAEGRAAQHGADGYVVDRFRRGREIQLSVRDDGTIDYKDLGWLQTVCEGDIICDIVPETEGEAGCSVRGAELKSKRGRKASAPRGQGTALSEDGAALTAATGGVVSFEGTCFRVDPLLVIKGNVDIAVGNIDTVGDVLIHGDVLDGFTVKSSGNVTVQGMAEGARLTAGSNIRVGSGMNGSGHGEMQAGGDILSRFIENATVTAGGNIVCDSIVNANVFCNDTVQVKTGRGTIVGGSVAARKLVEAKTIGNRAHRAIKVTLGDDVNYLRERAALETKAREVHDELSAVEKDLAYLRRGGAKPQTGKSPDELITGRMVLRRQQRMMDKQMADMRSAQKPVAGSCLLAETLYPPVEVEIFGAAATLRETWLSVEVRLVGKMVEARTNWE